jgi:uncharacterized membrane protein YeaQ/YmgE (transglycosylase-associated protein family)
MTNVFALLLIGGTLGWLLTALTHKFHAHEALGNIVAGALGSFSAGLISNGGTLYNGLNGLSLAAAGAGALIALGLTGLIRRRRSGRF